MQGAEKTIIEMLKLVFAFVKSFFRFIWQSLTSFHTMLVNFCQDYPKYGAITIEVLLVIIACLWAWKHYIKPKASQPELDKLLKVKTSLSFDKKSFHKLILWILVVIAFLTVIVLYLGMLDA